MIGGSASHPVCAGRKSPGEKCVTEQALEDPKCVEDIVRELGRRRDGEDRVTWYQSNSENFESIHSHNAYARITRDKSEG